MSNTHLLAPLIKRRTWPIKMAIPALSADILAKRVKRQRCLTALGSERQLSCWVEF